MKILIVHDSRYGNGEKVAETLKDVLGKTTSLVKVGHVRNLESLPPPEDVPDLVIVGAAVRMFQVSRASRKWLKKLDKSVGKSGAAVVFGAVFLTHMLKEKSIQGYGRRYLRCMQKMKNLDYVFPEWLSGQVEGQEGPLMEHVLPKTEKFAADLEKWMKEIKI
ncbi:MAG: hypothetical protein KAQ69_05270, partial [Spirochaetales bacterium]|nr:hypothetical protein [Spirochaetales bacterium]